MEGIETLRDTLISIKKRAGQEFTGVGIIVHDSKTPLPIFSLRLNSDKFCRGDVVDVLSSISRKESIYHDGFHLISIDWKITHISQYFSPPISHDVLVDRTKNFGGRYLAAQFGSLLPGVEICGVASAAFGIAIFRRGEEVHFEEI